MSLVVVLMRMLCESEAGKLSNPGSHDADPDEIALVTPTVQHLSVAGKARSSRNGGKVMEMVLRNIFDSVISLIEATKPT